LKSYRAAIESVSQGEVMEALVEGIARAGAIGTGATVVLDLWGGLLRRRGIPTLNFALLGRWIGHIPKGKWFHDGIAKAAPVRGELALGWAAHYAIGIAFAAILIAACGLAWARSPSLAPALLFGIGTVIAPLFILQPAMGAGIASSRTAAPVRNSLKSVLNHAVFGLGLYLAAWIAS
jgi:hypothetical protein